MCRYRLTSAALVLALSSWLSSFGCGSDDDPKAVIGNGCDINSDCESPLVCVFRQCHQQCEESRDCEEGAICVVGEPPYNVCQLEENSTCSYNSECPGDLVCAIDGRCRVQCKADLDCIPGQVCSTGTCAEPDELDNGELPIGANPPQGTGQPCAYNSQCGEGLVCLDGLCNLECLGDADCSPYTCDLETNRCDIPDAPIVYCIPGEQKTCGCPGGLSGSQVCEPGGQFFMACENCQ